MFGFYLELPLCCIRLHRLMSDLYHIQLQLYTNVGGCVVT